MRQVKQWLSSNQKNLFISYGIFAGLLVALSAGYIWGSSAITSHNAELYTVTLQATDNNIIALRGNPITGEVECKDNYGTVNVIGSYSADLNGMNITSGRRLSTDSRDNGGMTNITMNMKMISCVGYGTWKGVISPLRYK